MRRCPEAGPGTAESSRPRSARETTEERGAGAAGTRARRSTSLGPPGCGDQAPEAPNLGGGDLSTLGRKPVVPSPVIVEGGIGPLPRLLEEAGGEQSLDRRVERRRPKPDLAVGDSLDLGHDRVAVLLAGTDRDQDLNRRSREGSLVVCHDPTISIVDIASMDRVRPSVT